MPRTFILRSIVVYPNFHTTLLSLKDIAFRKCKSCIQPIDGDADRLRGWIVPIVMIHLSSHHLLIGRHPVALICLEHLRKLSRHNKLCCCSAKHLPTISIILPQDGCWGGAQHSEPKAGNSLSRPTGRFCIGRAS